MSRSTSFYYSFLVLPAPKRRAILAVFDFCRAVDDSVDLEPDPMRARAALDRWRDEVGRVFSNAQPTTAEGVALQPCVDPYHLPHAQFEALIDGVAMDAPPQRYRTFADLERYCHGVASSVGLICAEIFGYSRPAALDYARDLGVALQLTNILRDVAADLARGRFYLPLEDVARFNCTEDDFRREAERAGHGLESPTVRAVLEHHAARARVFFARAVRVLPAEDARAFVAAEIMRAVYADLLRRIEHRHCDVFSEVVRVPRPSQAWLAMRTWLKGSAPR